MLHYAALVAAVVEVDSAVERAVVALSAESIVGLAKLVGLKVEVAMPDQHRQGNSDKDWAT